MAVSTISQAGLDAPITLTSPTLTSPVITGSTPQVTVYTSGSGTYTVPANARFLQVKMVGGGGGGAGSGASGGSGGNGQHAQSARPVAVYLRFEGDPTHGSALVGDTTSGQLYYRTVPALLLSDAT
jgi:hypothetical protein